jgi:hypothetical protein
MRRSAIAIAASLSLVSVTTAQAAPAVICVTDQEMHGLVAFVLPDVLKKLSDNCATYLPPSSYFSTGLPKLLTGLNEGKDPAWPMAKAAFFKLGGPEKTNDMAKLSDRALRPLVDELVSQKLTMTVSAPLCGEANDIAESLSPLSATQTVHTVATLFNAFLRSDKKLGSCPRATN